MRENPIPSIRPNNSGNIYTLDVTLVNGPMSDSFLEENPVVRRSIQIRGDQTLEDFHDIIFTAFDREDDNMYEFRFPKESNDQHGRCYVLPSEMSGKNAKRTIITGDVTRTRIDSLGLKKGMTFNYWFDFEDDWLHQIAVISVDDRIPSGKFPRVIARIGESPAQYQDYEDYEDSVSSEYEEWNLSY